MKGDQLLHRFFDRLNEHISVAPALRLTIAEALAIRQFREDRAVLSALGDLHFVLSGFVVKTDKDDSILEFLPEGEFMFGPAPNDDTYFICKTDTTIATLSQDSILAILKEHVVFQLYMSMIVHTVLTKRQIRSKLLAKPVRQRKELFYRMFPEVVQCRPMYEIASYLGSNPNYFGSI